MKITQQPISRIMLLLLGVTYLIAMHLVMPNNGGSGADLPEPLLIWGLMVLMAIVGTLSFLRQNICISVSAKWFSFAAVLMTLPLVWSSHADWVLDALPRFGGLWAGILLYVLFLNCRFTPPQIKWLLYGVAVAALIQALYSLAGLHFPYLLPVFEQDILKHSPGSVGVFQQRNVTASFIATGGAVLLFILGSSFFECQNRHINHARKIAASAGTMIIYVVLTEIQSRIGWLSGICVYTGMLLLYWRRGTSVTIRFTLLLAPIAGIFCGAMLMNNTLTEALRQHDSSNLQRIMILHETWRMILMHPLMGWGYGSYVWSFAHFIADRVSPVDTGGVFIPHPHNEILYWWMEGGALALSGVIILCYAGGRLLLSINDKKGFAIFICILPLLLHTQVEYPFYQSPIHWLTLILFLSLIDNRPQCECHITYGKWWRSVVMTGGAIVLFFILGLVAISLRNEFILTKFERQPDEYYQNVLLLPETGISTERIRRLKAEALIVDYQHKNNISQLHVFTHDAYDWLRTWEDADMYDNLIKINSFLGRKYSGEHLREEAHRLFVADPRFDEKSST